MNGYRFSIVFTIFNFEYLQGVVFDDKSLQSQQQRRLRKKAVQYLFAVSLFGYFIFILKIANAMV